MLEQGQQEIQEVTDQLYSSISFTKGQIPDLDKLKTLFIPDGKVTNAGFNGVQFALAQGVPLVTAGQTEEKPEICARVQWSGVGIDLKTSTPKPTQIRNAVKKILGSSQYRQQAEQFKAEIARYDAPALAIKLLEQLAETKKPVLRTTAN